MPRSLPPGDFADADPCGVSVLAGVSCTIPITFTPTATGPRTGVLILTDNAPGSPHSIVLSGIGTAPAVTLSAASLAFSGQGVTTTSAAQDVRLTNSGTGNLVIASIIASGDFAETNTCGASVAPGVACDISVTFKPQATGAATGTIAITDNAGSDSQTVALVGSGVLPFSLASDHGFVAILKGSDSASFNISIASLFGFTGTLSLGCSGIASANCIFNPVSAAPGQGSTLTVNNLSAVTAGSLPFTVTGSSGALSASMPLTVLLSDFTISSSPTSTTISAGNSAVYALSFTPSNFFSQAISLTCLGTPAQATCSISPNTLMLDGSHALPTTVTVTTTARSTLVGRWDSIPRLPFLWAPRAANHPGRLACLLLALVMLSMVVAVTLRKLGRWQAAYPAIFLLAVFLASCGGGGGAPTPGPGPGPTGTPAGVYTLSLTATSGTLSHNITVTLTVN